MKLLYVTLFLFVCSCKEAPEQRPTSTPSKNPTQDEPDIYQGAAQERSAILAKPFVYGYMAIPTAHTTMSTYYHHLLPKATVLGDYNQKPFRCLMAINLGWAFEKNLPPDLTNELKARDLLGKKLVDIFVVFQPLESLGGNTAGSDTNITYLKAHGWADPDAPIDFERDRIKRNFLYGIFSPSLDISYEVKRGELKPFMVYTHDYKLSPQTAALRLPNSKSDSIALYSLVIDHENPNKSIKAIATLHLLVSDQDHQAFFDENFEEREVDRHVGGKVTTDVVKAGTVQKFIADLQKGSLKEGVLVKAITELTKL